MACVHNSQSHRSGVCFGSILSLILAVSCAIAIAATWLLLGPSYEVSGAIRVDPMVSNIITGQENGGGISNYTNFVATQAIQDELVLTKKMQDAISRRIQEFKMERKRPARISVACKADILARPVAAAKIRSTKSETNSNDQNSKFKTGITQLRS
jgi:hypothetical protein